MPQDSVYGAWPRSGEIDIAEMRGNDAETYPLGNNIISAALHWGPDPEQDGFYLSRGQWGTQRDKYSNAFHTYGLEWSKDYLFMWVDGRLQVYLSFLFMFLLVMRSTNVVDLFW
jgi:hypothetical protein